MKAENSRPADLRVKVFLSKVEHIDALDPKTLGIKRENNWS